MIDMILPPTVACAEYTHDPPEARPYPTEEALLARSVEKRRREFVTGRHCAREALAALGEPAVPILRGPKGEPLWPDGVIGSITHCTGYRAAALAHTDDIHTIGIDAEPHLPLPDGVLDAVSLPAERAHLREDLHSTPGIHWDRLLFCVKESVYKAWYPLTTQWLGFEQARVTIEPDSRTFSAQLLIPGPHVAGRLLTGFSGRWLITDDLILTAIALLL